MIDKVIYDFECFRNEILKYIIFNKDKKQTLPQLFLKDEEFLNMKEKQVIGLDQNQSPIQLTDYYVKRLSVLFSFLRKADEKIEEVQKEEREFSELYTSKLQAVHDVVKNSDELIFGVYLLEWLFEINKIKYNNTKYHSSTIKINSLKGFFNDILHSNPQTTPDQKSYVSAISELKVLLFQGKLQEAQEQAEKIGLNNVSKNIGNQLPFHDNSFDNQFKGDYSLLPLFCRTNQLKKYQALKIENQNYVRIGNFMWDKVIEDKWNLVSNSADYLKPLNALISGYPYQSDDRHENFLFNLNSLINCKILEKCHKLNYEEIHFCNESNEFFLNKPNFLNSLFDLINHLKKEETSKNDQDIFFLIELNLISMHLLKLTETTKKNTYSCIQIKKTTKIFQRF